jgi:hypothetical protein
MVGVACVVITSIGLLVATLAVIAVWVDLMKVMQCPLWITIVGNVFVFCSFLLLVFRLIMQPVL